MFKINSILSSLLLTVSLAKGIEPYNDQQTNPIYNVIGKQDFYLTKSQKNQISNFGLFNFDNTTGTESIKKLCENGRAYFIVNEIEHIYRNKPLLFKMIFKEDPTTLKYKTIENYALSISRQDIFLNFIKNNSSINNILGRTPIKNTQNNETDLSKTYGLIDALSKIRNQNLCLYVNNKDGSLDEYHRFEDNPDNPWVHAIYDDGLYIPLETTNPLIEMCDMTSINQQAGPVPLDFTYGTNEGSNTPTFQQLITPEPKKRAIEEYPGFVGNMGLAPNTQMTLQGYGHYPSIYLHHNGWNSQNINQEQNTFVSNKPSIFEDAKFPFETTLQKRKINKKESQEKPKGKDVGKKLNKYKRGDSTLSSINIMDLFKKLGVEEWAKSEAMNPGTKRKFLFGGCNYVLKLNNLEENFCTHLKDILTEDMKDGFSVDENNLKIEAEYYSQKISILNEYFEKNEMPDIYLDTNLYKAEYQDLFLKVIGIRLVKEIIDHNIPFENATQPLDDCKTDFIALCNNNNPNMKDRKGMSASNYFMQKHRLKTGKVHTNSILMSPVETFKNFEMHTLIATNLKEHFFNKEGNLIMNATAYTNDNFFQRIVDKRGAFQFRPSYVKYILNTLKEKYNITVNKICDWSTGWGDRLLGTLASVNSLNINQYIGTDPNTSLHEDYMNICQTFVPSGYVVDPAQDVNNNHLIKVEYKHQFDPTKTLKIKIHKKPAEDLTNEELHEGESDLMLTSIPYFNKELYAGEQQSHRRYQTYEKKTEDNKSWKEGFLIPFVNQTVKSLKNEGIIAINTASVNPKQSTKFNTDGLDIGEHKIYDDLKQIMSNYNMNGINLKYICEIPYALGIYSAHTMVFKVNKPYACVPKL